MSLKLLELDGGTDAFELGLEGLGIFLGDAFLDLGGDALDQSLGLGQAQTGDAADFLDDLDLLSAEIGHDDVELGLLLDSSGSAGGVTALDATAASYNAFIGAQRDPAVAYDAVLDLYYHGKYELRTVAQLGASVSTGDWVATHYGDWPAPELWVINTAG